MIPTDNGKNDSFTGKDGITYAFGADCRLLHRQPTRSHDLALQDEYFESACGCAVDLLNVRTLSIVRYLGF